MPCATMQVYALRAVGQKGHGLGRCGQRHDHQKRMLRHGDKGLAAIRMPLDQIEAVGQGAGLGLKDRNARLGPAGINLRKVVVALAKAIVDQAEIACGVEDIAKGGKGLGGQGRRCDVLQGVYSGKFSRQGFDHRFSLGDIL